MAEKPTAKPALQKPPGYRDPALQKPPGYRDPALPPPPQRRPPAQLHPAFRHPGKPLPRRRRSGGGGAPSLRRALCCALAAALALTLAAAAAAALAYLYYQPRLPSFLLLSVRPHRARISPRSDGGDAVDAATSVRLLARNPNGKIALEYGPGEAAVAAEDEDGDVATGAGPRARFRSKSVRFKVEVRTRVGILVGGKGTWKVPIRVECSPVSLKRAQGDGDPIPCRIYWFKWINLN
ncbi:uncharacterized protein LOC109717916 [Ananas comosus]|uniref:Uncharacterized protein LOC109717916 n=1 Tax=Ananas comosus TaxID=4615 RepID=A0A6P5G2E5_ANACO|nr:uncharacterized protein LOC109717916 [Ananas comosus]